MNMHTQPWDGPAAEPLPHNIEEEQHLLGAILLQNAVFAYVDQLVAAEDFFEPIHRKIFAICSSLIGDGKLASPVTLKNFLPADLDIAGLTLGQYLARLVTVAPTIINAPDFARSVRDLANSRRMIEVLVEGSDMLRAAPVDMAPDAIATRTIECIDKIISGRIPHQLRAVSVGDAAREAMAQLSEAMAGSGKATGIIWGLTDLDRRTDGIQRGELSILAGRPGMCKTAFALHVALSASAANHRALYWSGEMTHVALAQRALTAISYKQSGGRVCIPYENLRGGHDVRETDFELLRDAQDYLDSLPLIIEEQPSLTIAQIAVRARRFKQKEGLDLLILDHLHKIRAAERYSGDPTAEIGEISNACAILAKELDIGVLALCQLNRESEKREHKRPMLSDLRQSGSLEQDADIVIFPFREAYYLLQNKPKMGTAEHIDWAGKLDSVKNRLEIIIAKHRQGATGAFDAFCAIEANAICDAARNDESARVAA